MKNILFNILFTIGLAIVVIGPTVEQPAQAQVAYCGHCCDTDPYGNARVRCTLVSSFPCGGTCECVGVVGYGFACY